MKNVSLLVFMTQLGLSVALPLTGFVLLGVWLRRAFDWGAWVVIAGALLGILVAAEGLRNTLKTMERMAQEQKETPLCYNEHD